MDQILKFVNIARKIQGLKPLRKLLKGVQADGFSCPLSRSLNASYVATHAVRFKDIEVAKKVEEAWWNGTIKSSLYPNIKIPKELSLFIDDFDDGVIPELQLKGDRVR